MINCEPDIRQWCEWAMDNRIAPTVTGFLRWRPELLISKEIPGEGAFPSPRSWEATSHILGLQMSPAIEREMILGRNRRGRDHRIRCLS